MTDLPVPNIPLLRKVLDHIDAHPEEWNQEFWISVSSCGTACCIAGWATLMSGQYQPVVRSGIGHEVRAVDGTVHRVDVVAQRELGLADGEAERLFRATNQRCDIQYYASTIALRAGEIL